MRSVFIYMTTSLDGFISGPNNELDWMLQTADPELTRDMVALFERVEGGFLGYPTYTGMIPYWRSVADDPSASEGAKAIANAVNKLRPIADKVGPTVAEVATPLERMPLVPDDTVAHIFMPDIVPL